MTDSPADPNPPSSTPPAPAGPTLRPDDPKARGHHVPRGTAEFGMKLFLASLGLLFAASMLGYILIRIWAADDGRIDPTTNEAIPPQAPPLGSLDLPMLLFLSTGLILLSSYTVQQALIAVRREQQAKLRQYMLFTMMLAVGFLLIQAPSLASLLFSDELTDKGYDSPLFKFIFVLVLIHALHLVGGILPLAVVTRHALRGEYDHESHTPVKLITMYWHFLDGVWIVMFGVMLVLK